MIIYFDGGSHLRPKNTPNRKDYFDMTYGVLFHHGDETPVERNGVYQLPLKYNSVYEYVAFLEAFKLLKEQNIDYKKVSFYTDSEDIAYAQTYLHKDNYMVARSEKLLGFLEQALEVLQMQNYKGEVVDCLLHSRFVKIKSHTKNFIVDNVRVDYLAKSAFYKKEPLQYQEFLQCGFYKQKDAANIVTFNLPFVPKNHKNTIKI